MSDLDPTVGPHDRPTATELLEAVREFLERDLLEGPALDGASGRVRFHTRVAVNVLAMVEREVRLGPEQALAHRTRLATLGFPDDMALAAAIRRGDLDDRYDEVKAAVWASVRDKLRVANPAHLDDEDAQAPRAW